MPNTEIEHRGCLMLPLEVGLSFAERIRNLASGVIDNIAVIIEDKMTYVREQDKNSWGLIKLPPKRD